MPYTLSDHERARLIDLRDHGAAPLARRAQIILLSEPETPVAAIAAAVSLTRAQVYHWRREWLKRRLDIFPALAESTPGDAAAHEIAPVLAPGIETPRLPLQLRETVGMLPDDSMAEAARKALFFHFERMLLNEPGSREGQDIEAVHDMRVATRRMRSALRLFKPFFAADALRPFKRRLRRIALALGEVRDLDVFMEKARLYLHDHPEVDLSPLMAAWEVQRQQARCALIEQMDSKGFGRFVTEFHAFLTTPGMGAIPLPGPADATAYQVRHIAPRVIYEHYEQVRAYDAVLDGASLLTLHALRIAFKRLRYTVEFFQEVLGPEAKPVIKEIKTMQDHLGDLNDTRVEGEVLREFVDRHNAEYSGVPIFLRPDISGVLHYARAREAEQEHLRATFPDAWANFSRDDVRRALALAVSAL
jgi:CHAD domain-containing protein